MVERLVHLDLAQPCAQLLVVLRHLLVLIARWMAVVLLKLPGAAVMCGETVWRGLTDTVVGGRWRVAGGGTHFSQRRRRKRMIAFCA